MDNDRRYKKSCWYYFHKVEWGLYWFKFWLKFPERIVAGISSGLIVYAMIRLLGL